MALVMTKKNVGSFELSLGQNDDAPSMPYYGEFIGE